MWLGLATNATPLNHLTTFRPILLFMGSCEAHSAKVSWMSGRGGGVRQELTPTRLLGWWVNERLALWESQLPTANCQLPIIADLSTPRQSAGNLDKRQINKLSSIKTKIL